MRAELQCGIDAWEALKAAPTAGGNGRRATAVTGAAVGSVILGALFGVTLAAGFFPVLAHPGILIAVALSGLAALALRLDAGRRVRRDHEAVATQLRLIADSLAATACGAIITDTSGVIRWVNPAFTSLTGYRREDVIGLTPRILKSGQQAACTYDRLWATLRAGRVWRGELVNRRRDGSTYWEEQTITPLLSADGTITHFIGIKQDITARHAAETERGRTQTALEEQLAVRSTRLTAAQEQLESFAHTISHDLRVPVRTIEHGLRELEEHLGAALDPSGHVGLARLQAACHHAEAVIQGMKILFKLAREDLNVVEVDLSALATELADELRHANLARQMEFRITPGLRVRGDRHLLQIALANLLGNAVHFTRHQPVAHIEFGSVPYTTGTAFFVSDNGVGFNPASTGRLFMPFERLQPTDGVPHGGIGLASVHRIVQRHGGRVWARGTVGEGATILFSLGEFHPPQ